MVNTSWQALSKGTLDVMAECVRPSQWGYGGTHEENGIAVLITHYNAYAAPAGENARHSRL